MKKLLILFSALFLNFNVWASHLMGGEIIVINDQIGHYEVLLTLYRDTLGIQMANTQDITVYNSSGTAVMNLVSQLDTSLYHPIFGMQNGSLIPFYPYGIEAYFYRASFPCSIPGEYTVSWDKCCRNGAILNISNPLNVDMQLHSTFTVDLTSLYSTPYFMTKPVVFLPVNTPFQYNPLPFDPDGDSLVWSIDIPNESSSSNLAEGIPISGYSNPPSVSGGNLSINSITGTVSWTPSIQGNFVYTVKCEEYRNGVKVGDIRRDMQFIVLSPGSGPSLININNLPNTNTGVPYAEVVAGDLLDLELYAIDSSVNNILFEAYGESFNLDSNAMTYSQEAADEPFKTKLSLLWSPTINEARVDPYVVVLRLLNGTYSMDYTIYVYVNQSSVSISEPDLGLLNVYPNPTKESFVKPIKLSNKQTVVFNIYDYTGKIVSSKTSLLNKGTHNIRFDLNLNKGGYILESIFENGKKQTEQIIVSN